MLWYLFKWNTYLDKKRFYTSYLNRDHFVINSLIKLKDYSFYTQYDECWIFVNGSDILGIKELQEQDSKRFIWKYYKELKKDVSLNSDLTEKQKDEFRKKNIMNIENLNTETWWEKWDEEYEKKWVNDDMKKDSDLVDFDEDWNFLYEDSNEFMDTLFLDYNWTKI